MTSSKVTSKGRYQNNYRMCVCVANLVAYFIVESSTVEHFSATMLLSFHVIWRINKCSMEHSNDGNIKIIRCDFIATSKSSQKNSHGNTNDEILGLVMER